MAEPTVGLSIDADVATITLCRPEVGNALDIPTSLALGDALESIASDSLSALVLRGAGKAFSVGGDLRGMAAAADRGRYLAELADAAHRAIRMLAVWPSPVVAVVDGAAAGAGLAITLLADVVLVGDRARFAVAYPSVGLSPDCGMSWMLPRTVGRRDASRMALLGAPVGPDEAVRIGLATSRASSEELESEVSAALLALAGAKRQALRDTKALLAPLDFEAFSRHLDREARTISQRVDSAEAAALIDQFLAKSSSSRG